MESWPLVTKNTSCSCGDVTHTIREVFDDIYHKDIFTNQTLELFKKTKFDDLKIQKCGFEASEIYENHKSSIKSIEDIEQRLLENEVEKLEKLPNLNTAVAEEFCLVRKNDILPSVLQHKLDPLFDHQIEKDKSNQKSSNTNKQYPCNVICFDKILPKKADNQLLKNISWSCLEQKNSIINLKHDLKFKPEPEKIVFENYKINVLYEKTVKIRNVSQKKARFAIPQQTNIDKFTFDWSNTKTVLYPGMCTTFIVKFKTVTYDDCKTTLRINVEDGVDIVIKLISKRPSPLLSGIIYYGPSTLQIYESFIENSQRINQVLNSTIDCKQCMIGQRNKIAAYFSNYGANASFFLMSEISWYNMVINEVTNDLVLRIPPFYIYPAYFTLENSELKEINIEYVPTEYGLHIDRIFIACDNCTYNVLDLIGDGVYYQPNYVLLQIPKKMFSVVSSSAVNSKYTLDLGKIFPYGKTDDFDILVRNNSVFKLNFRWSMRNIELKGNLKTICNNMKQSWISLNPRNGSLNGEAVTSFVLNVKGNTKICGVYWQVLELYITGIPEAALDDNRQFYVVETSDYEQSGLVDIFVGEIELSLEIVKPSIIIDPCLLNFEMSKIGLEDLKRTVRIFNTSEFKISCTWVLKDINVSDKTIDINPKKFEIEENGEFKCQLSVADIHFEKLKAHFVCKIDYTDVEKSFVLTIRSNNPEISVSDKILNFGFVKYATTTKKTFSIINKSDTDVEWFLTEYFYNFDEKRLRKRETTGANKNHGYLCRKGSGCEVEYNLYTGNIGKWCSLLTIEIPTFSTVRQTSNSILIYADIVSPNIGIYAPKFQTAYLILDDCYFGQKKEAFISLRNHSPIQISYVWGKPEGSDVDMLDVKITPESGELDALENHLSTICLVPKMAGTVEDYQIPCFVGKMLTPIWLSVKIEIKDIQVVVTKLQNATEDKSVWWPRKKPELVKMYAIESGIPSPESSLLDEFPKMVDEESVPSIHYKPSGIHIDYNSCSCESSENLSEKSSSIYSIDYPLGMSYTTFSSHSSYETLRSPLELFKMENSHEKEYQVCRELNREKCPCCPMVIEFPNVPLNTPVKQTIQIRNLTPVKARCSTTVRCHNVLKVEEETIQEKINKKIGKIQKENYNFKKMKNGKGLIIKIDPEEDTLEANDVLYFDIWVYGNTWGFYFDEVTIDFERTKPFQISVMVEIVGHPIIFPALKLCHQDEPPVIRFGHFTQISDSEWRILKLKNTACIPVCIVWHTFLTFDADDLPKSTDTMSDITEIMAKSQESVETLKKDFSLLLDLYSLSDEHTSQSKLDLQLTSYYGEEDSGVYSIEPQETFLQPEETQTIQIIFHPQNCRTHWKNMNISGLLVGNLKISEKDSFLYACYKRKASDYLSPIRINLEANMISPLLTVDLKSSDCQFVIYANEVTEKNKILHIERTFILQNNTPVTISSKVTIDAPFCIIHIQTNKERRRIYERSAEFNFPEKSCAKIMIQCTISPRIIQNISNTISNDDDIQDFTVEDTKVTIPYKLTFEQEDLSIRQEIPLEVIIYYPDITISTSSLNFESLTIGSYKTLYISLTNRTGKDIKFYTTRQSNTKEFTVTPTSGILPGSKAGQYFPFDVYVKFTPTETKSYMDKVYFCTSMSTFKQEVILQGSGSLNLRCPDDQIPYTFIHIFLYGSFQLNLTMLRHFEFK